MITSRQNRRLKDIRRLRRSKGGRVLLEGPHLIEAALEAEIVLEEVLASPEYRASDEGQRLEAAWEDAGGGEILEVSPGLLRELADADSPRGMVAIGRWSPRPIAEIPAVDGGIYVYADGLQDPGNVGAVARSIEAVGAAALILSPNSVHPGHPRALRASAGSILRLPVATGVAPQCLLDHLSSNQPRFVPLVPRGGQELPSCDLSGTLVLALGAEGPGLEPEITRLGQGVTIPLASSVESLNVAVAAGIVLYEARRRRG